MESGNEEKTEDFASDESPISIHEHLILTQNSSSGSGRDQDPLQADDVDAQPKAVESLYSNNYYEGVDIRVSGESIDKITKGLVQNILPSLEKAKVSLDETLKNQDVLIETVQQENEKFTECSSMVQLTDIMKDARVYYNKLITIKKDMNLLSERSTRLKRRAVRLQQQKQKEEQHIIQQREKELEREQKLIAKVVKRGDTQ